VAILPVNITREASERYSEIQRLAVKLLSENFGPWNQCVSEATSRIDAEKITSAPEGAEKAR
jgi:hypothetical protein